MYEQAAALVDVPEAEIPMRWQERRLGENALDDATARIEAVMQAALHEAGAGDLDWMRVFFLFSPVTDGEIRGQATYRVTHELEIVVLTAELAIDQTVEAKAIARVAVSATEEARRRLRIAHHLASAVEDAAAAGRPAGSAGA